MSAIQYLNTDELTAIFHEIYATPSLVPTLNQNAIDFSNLIQQAVLKKNNIIDIETGIVSEEVIQRYLDKQPISITLAQYNEILNRLSILESK